MSIAVNIKNCKRELDFNQVVEKLREDGCNISVIDSVPNLCKFYLPCLSTRLIELSLEDDGYEIRITTLASRDDYELYTKTLSIIQQLTESEVFAEENEKESIVDVRDYFDATWIDRQMENDVSLICVLGKKYEIGLYGPVCMFYVGENLFGELGIKAEMDWREISDKLITRFLYSQYSRPLDIRRTSTSITIDIEDDNKDENAQKNRLTYYKHNDYDMISRTDYIALVGDGKTLLLKYEDFMKVVPAQWERFDNCQYFTSPLSDKQFYDLWCSAMKYSIDRPAEQLNFTKEQEGLSKSRMIQALIYDDVNYIRDIIQQQGLPSCAKMKPSKDYEPPLFYTIARCQEIIFNSEDYADEYMPVILQMREKARKAVEYWEREAGIPKWKSFPFQILDNWIDMPSEDDTIEDVMGYEPKDFRDAGFSNADLLLYMGAQKFDFKRVQASIKGGVNPNLEFYPASEEGDIFCTAEDIHVKAYDNFQYLYALYRWYLDTGEMVVSSSDSAKIISCAAYTRMYEFIKEQREKYA